MTGAMTRRGVRGHLQQRRHRWGRPASMVALALLVAVGLAACASVGAASDPRSVPPRGSVNVAYAGSLVNLMEHQLGPAFQRATGYGYQGEGAGSTALANQIKGRLIQPDVFISASAGAMTALQGQANGNRVAWSLSFASTQMVIGYNPKSQFAGQLQAAAEGQTPWYRVLETPGLRLGRTDPALDPKGVNTLFTLQLAERYYQQPELAERVLGMDENAGQIFPEQELVARLGAGQLDAGFFYLSEVKAAGLPYIALPAQINLGDPAQAPYYAQARYSAPGKAAQTGAPVLYSVAILTTAKNAAGADAFVRYLLGSAGEQLLTADGIQPITPVFVGDATKVPADLASYAR